MMRYKKAIIITIMLVIFMTLYPCAEARASGISDIEDFNNLSGNAKYLGENYRDNYSFDIEETGLLDSGKAMVNEIANMLFSAIRTIAYLVVSIFYYAMDLDIGKLLEPFINGIQKSLKSGIFDPLFILAFCGTAVLIIKKLMLRDAMGIVSEFIKVIVIVVLATFVVTDSGTALSYATKITKSISVNALSGMNDGKSGSSFAADAAGVLWEGMVHDPWVSMEFGYTSGGRTASDKTIKEFLNTKPDSKERAQLVKEYMAANPDATNFSKGKGGERVAFSFVYFFPFLFKAVVFLLVALIQLAFQALAVGILLLAPIVLILALIPGYEMNVITIWLKKLLETQLGILVITFMIGLLVKFDAVMYTLSGKLGWFIVLIIQVAVAVTLFLERNKILSMFSNIQKNMNNPAYFKNQLRRSGNLYEGIEKGRDKLMQLYDNHRPLSRGDSISAFDHEDVSYKAKSTTSTEGNSESPARPSLQNNPPDPPSPPNPPDPAGTTAVPRRVIRTDLDIEPPDKIEVNRPRPNLKEASGNDANSNIVYLREYLSSERNGRERITHDRERNESQARSIEDRREAAEESKVAMARPRISVGQNNLDPDPTSQSRQIEASEMHIERPRTSAEVQSSHQADHRSQERQIEAPEMSLERPRTGAEVQSSHQADHRSQERQIEAPEMPLERPRASAEVQSSQQSVHRSQERQIEAPEMPLERPRASAEVQSSQQSVHRSQERQTEAPEMHIEQPRTSAEVQSSNQEVHRSREKQIEARLETSRPTLGGMERNKNTRERKEAEIRTSKIKNIPSEKTGTSE